MIISIRKEPLPLGCGRAVQPVWCCQEKGITEPQHNQQAHANTLEKRFEKGGWRTKFATVPPRKTTTDEADRVEHAARTETGASAFNPDRRRCAMLVSLCSLQTQQNRTEYGDVPKFNNFSKQTNEAATLLADGWPS